MWVRFPPPPPSPNFVGRGWPRSFLASALRSFGPRARGRFPAAAVSESFTLRRLPHSYRESSGDRRRRASDARDLRRHCAAFHRERAGSIRRHPMARRASRPRCRRARWSSTLARGRGSTPSNSAVAGSAPFSLDFSMGMLRAGVGEYPGPRLQGDARRLPFRAGALAGIWASASLLHLSRPHAAQALEDARRTLAPSGRLLLSVKQGHGCRNRNGPLRLAALLPVLVRLRARRGARRRRVPRHRRRDGDIAARRMARQAGRADRLTPRYACRVSGISRRGSSRRTRRTGSASRSRRAGTRCRGRWRA